MSNWATAKRRIIEEIHRYGPLDNDYAARAMCWVISRYGYENLKFNQFTDDFTTVAGTYAYDKESDDGDGDGYPYYMLMPIEVSLIVSDTYYPMKNEPIRQFRKHQVSSSYRGYPSEWVWYGEQLLLDPTPNGAYTVRVDYTKDIGTPKAVYDSDSWTYSVNGVTVGDSYTSEWFTQGLEFLIAASKYWVLANVFFDRNAATFAAVNLRDELMDIRASSQQSQIPSEAVPWS